ncbi:MAG: ATP-binding protein [Synergistaceae bacterium]|nr:ATP-binding protein [Candidatus Equadaptatus faecalis]
MLIARPAYLEQLISWKDTDLIKVVTGVRRCGKSVLLFDIFSDWLLNNGVSAKHLIKVNLEDRQNAALRNPDALYSYVREAVKGRGKYYLLLDEVQYIDAFEDVLNSFKNMGCDVYVTGSNSKLLSSDVSTALRGRSIDIKVYPLSFAEYYSYAGGDVRKAFNSYMLYGGFPYIASETEANHKTKYLKMLEETVATKDIISHYKLRSPALFNAVYDFLCSNIGCLISPKKISDTLKTNGYPKITPDTVGNYLQYLCEAFLFYKVYRYDLKGKGYLKTLNKYYAVDTGLRNAKLNYRQTEITHILENIVYLELLRRGYTVDIGKNAAKEIDFVAKDGMNTYYIQVAYTVNDAVKRQQELSSFYGLDDAYRKIVVTMDDDPFTILENGYKKFNIFDFLLNQNSLTGV